MWTSHSYSRLVIRPRMLMYNEDKVLRPNRFRHCHSSSLDLSGHSFLVQGLGRKSEGSRPLKFATYYLLSRFF